LSALGLFAIIDAGAAMEPSFFANRQLAHCSPNFDIVIFMESSSDNLDV
jgi:hypothetical protein